VLEGIAGLGIGIAAAVWPGITALTLVILIGAWALVTGVLEIVAAIQLRHAISNEWLLGLSGLLSVLFGLAVVIFPGAGALALVWLIGLYALVFGALLIGLGLRLRSLRPHSIPVRRVEGPAASAPDHAGTRAHAA
jgi:uncharacterized membrane protein HdeD (DUF308 family)